MRLLIASTSTVHGGTYLGYLKETVAKFFAGKTVTFIPYARPGGITHEAYTAKAREAFNTMGIQLRGIHEFESPKKAVADAQAFFTGGGNTFLLTDMLHRKELMKPLAEAVRAGAPYMGSSAGSNIAGQSMQTTNDMPIVYPPSFSTLGLLPFNLNPHYLDPDPDSLHMGETRETRIKEFHSFNSTPVLGLREGSWLEVEDERIFLRGSLTARLFRQEKDPVELPTDERIILD